jgi:Ubiquitin family
MLDVVIKPTSASSGGAERFSVSIDDGSTVLQLKEEVAKHCSVAADQQRLIYKGKILKDTLTVKEYGTAAAHRAVLWCRTPVFAALLPPSSLTSY